MGKIKELTREDDVNNLKPGDWIMINGKQAMRRHERGDGTDYLIPNGNGTITRINLGSYHIKNGGIVPVLYKFKLINLREMRAG